MNGNEEDLLFGTIAVDAGLVPRDRLDECVRLQEQLAREGRPERLAQILVRQGVITARHRDWILEHQAYVGARAIDCRLGILAVRNGLCTEAQVSECLESQTGIYTRDRLVIPIGVILTQKGYLTQQQVDAVLSLQQRLVAQAPPRLPAQEDPPRRRWKLLHVLALMTLAAGVVLAACWRTEGIAAFDLPQVHRRLAQAASWCWKAGTSLLGHDQESTGTQPPASRLSAQELEEMAATTKEVEQGLADYATLVRRGILRLKVGHIAGAREDLQKALTLPPSRSAPPPEAVREAIGFLSSTPEQALNPVAISDRLEHSRPPSPLPRDGTARVGPSVQADAVKGITPSNGGSTSIKEAKRAGVVPEQASDVEALLRTSVLCLQRSDRASALKALVAAAAKIPDLEDRLIRQAARLFGRRDLASALNAYQAAELLDGRSVEAFYGQGRVLAAQGKGSEALAVYRRALALHPASPWADRLDVAVAEAEETGRLHLEPASHADAPEMAPFALLAHPSSAWRAVTGHGPSAIALPDGTRIEIPRGALPSGTALTVELVDVRTGAIFYNAQQLRVYRVSTSVSMPRLERPLLLEVPTPADRTVLSFFDGSSWNAVPEVADPLATVPIRHFSSVDVASTYAAEPEELSARVHNWIRGLLGGPTQTEETSDSLRDSDLDSAKSFLGVGETSTVDHAQVCDQIRAILDQYTKPSSLAIPEDAPGWGEATGDTLTGRPSPLISHLGGYDGPGSGSYYWAKTQASMRQVQDWLQSRPSRSVSPAELLAQCVSASGGNVPLGVLTAHNLLKSQALNCRFDAYNRKSLSNVNAECAQTLDRLQTYRTTSDRNPDGEYDKIGPLYHLFAAMVAAIWGHGLTPEVAVVGEWLMRNFRVGTDVADPEKGEADLCGYSAGMHVREHVPDAKGETQPGDQASPEGSKDNPKSIRIVAALVSPRTVKVGEPALFEILYRVEGMPPLEPVRLLRNNTIAGPVSFSLPQVVDGVTHMQPEFRARVTHTFDKPGPYSWTFTVDGSSAGYGTARRVLSFDVTGKSEEPVGIKLLDAWVDPKRCDVGEQVRLSVVYRIDGLPTVETSTARVNFEGISRETALTKEGKPLYSAGTAGVRITYTAQVVKGQQVVVPSGPETKDVQAGKVPPFGRSARLNAPGSYAWRFSIDGAAAGLGTVSGIVPFEVSEEGATGRETSAARENDVSSAPAIVKTTATARPYWILKSGYPRMNPDNAALKWDDHGGMMGRGWDRGEYKLLYPTFVYERDEGDWYGKPSGRATMTFALSPPPPNLVPEEGFFDVQVAGNIDSDKPQSFGVCCWLQTSSGQVMGSVEPEQFGCANAVGVGAMGGGPPILKAIGRYRVRPDPPRSGGESIFWVRFGPMSGNPWVEWRYERRELSPGEAERQRRQAPIVQGALTTATVPGTPGFGPSPEASATAKPEASATANPAKVNEPSAGAGTTGQPRAATPRRSGGSGASSRQSGATPPISTGQGASPPGARAGDKLLSAARPWEHPEVQKLIDQFLAVSKPDIIGSGWHWTPWAQAISPPSINDTGPPEHGSLSRYEYLWEHGAAVASASHGTLRQFVERSLRGEATSLQGSAAPSIQSPRIAAQPSADARAGTLAAVRPSPRPSRVESVEKPDASEYSKYVQRGVARDRNGDHDGAIAFYTKALSISPRNAWPHVLRGIAHDSKRDHDRAIADYTAAIDIDPHNSHAYRLRGASRRDRGDNDGAIADLTKAVSLDPSDDEAFFGRALARQIAGDIDGAIADYDAALKVNPHSDNALCNRGLLRRQKGDIDGAIADFNAALTIDPRDPVVLYNRSLARNARGDHDGAIEDCTRALKLKPHYADAFVSRANARNAKGDVEGALADNATALRVAPPGWRYRTQVVTAVATLKKEAAKTAGRAQSSARDSAQTKRAPDSPSFDQSGAGPESSVDGSGPSPPSTGGPPTLHGTFRGAFGGGAQGELAMSIQGADVSGSFGGTYQGYQVSSFSLTGSYDSATGRLSGTLNGEVTVLSTRVQLQGTWTGQATSSHQIQGSWRGEGGGDAAGGEFTLTGGD